MPLCGEFDRGRHMVVFTDATTDPMRPGPRPVATAIASTMQTALSDSIRTTPEGREADRILRACVHCGFCTATCPTYQLLGDELDGPRGRIYLIKQLLEGDAPSSRLRNHLDRCLGCRACETTCPSGVEYHRLLDIGRGHMEAQLPRPWWQRLVRRGLIEILTYPQRLDPLLRIARRLRPLMPASLRRHLPVVPTPIPAMPLDTGADVRHMLILGGCVQSGLAPQINQAAVSILARLGVRVDTVSEAGCCGALPQHLSDEQRARVLARQNIDAWYPHLQAGAEYLLVTASGCGAHIKDYPKILADDAQYAERAQFVAARMRDPVEILEGCALERLALTPSAQPTAVHTPCTLQHGLGLNGRVEGLLIRLGYTLVTVADGHLCCGSAGTFSLLQPQIAKRLRERKLTALRVNQPQRIVTANIGCLMHLQEPDAEPVIHWLNLIAADLT